MGDYPDWLLDWVAGVATTVVDTFTGAYFGVVSFFSNAVESAEEARTEVLKIDQSAENHYKNIWSIGSGESDEILPVIVEKETTIEDYKAHCVDIHSDLFTATCDRDQSIPSEIYGYLYTFDRHYYKIHKDAGISAGLEYFPKTLAGVIPGGSDVVESINDLNSDYKVLGGLS